LLAAFTADADAICSLLLPLLLLLLRLLVSAAELWAAG
jgi:hypothetical protein